MQEMFKPVLESNAEMANEITQDLVPIKHELETLNKTILYRDRMHNRIQAATPRRILPEIPPVTPTRPVPTIPQILQEMADTPLPSKSKPVRYGPVAAKYLMNALNTGNDTVTGIRYVDSNMMIGNKKVEIQDNNLKIGDTMYDGTPGLWGLITEKKPKH